MPWNIDRLVLQRRDLGHWEVHLRQIWAIDEEEEKEEEDYREE